MQKEVGLGEGWLFGAEKMRSMLNLILGIKLGHSHWSKHDKQNGPGFLPLAD